LWANSHVIRGEDHISNTPKQLLIIEALGFKKPEYAHLPLILGSDRSKLSKRHGATSIIDYKEEGYLPEALFNFIALLGWNPGDDREILSKDELIKEFSLDKVQKAGAIFDLQKLDWMNGEYIRKKTPKELLQNEDFKLHILAGAGGKKVPQEYLEKVVALEQPRLKKLSEVGERTDYFFQQPKYDKELLRWKKMTDEEIITSLDTSIKVLSNLSRFNLDNIEKVFLKEIGERDKGVLLWPLRVALSGKKASPGPFEIIEILGKEESFKRLETAQKYLKS